MLRISFKGINRFFSRLASALKERRLLQTALTTMSILILAVLASIWIGNQIVAPAQPESTTERRIDENLIAHVPQNALSRGNSLIVGVAGPINLLNPLFSYTDGEDDANALIFESLLRLDSEGEPIGCLALDWNYDYANQKMTFRLRQDRTFPDGRAVNIDDVIFTYTCLLADSYNGPLRGRFSAVTGISPGPDSDQIVFKFQGMPEEPDYRLFTVGIIRADRDLADPERVFAMLQSDALPEGSGPFTVLTWEEDRLVLQLRPGFGGSIRQITFRRIASEDKFSLLQNGELDIVRNDWDIRMRQRASSLTGYELHHLNSSIDCYLLVSPASDLNRPIQLPSQRAAILMAGTGQELNDSQRLALEGLRERLLVLYYFEGLDRDIHAENNALAETIARRLLEAGLTVSVSGLDWPELAARADSHNYDILLLPATANNRLPENTNLLTDQFNPDANALVAAYRQEVYIVSKRIINLNINPFSRSLTASPGTWTDRIENIRVLDHNGAIPEGSIP